MQLLMMKLAGTKDVEVVAVEPTACPSLTGGEFRYDFGDTVGLTPLLKMYTMGHEYVRLPYMPEGCGITAIPR